uniref:Xylulose kinase-1 n=1 Tax=Tanacetum cinerariifolium TaxID=118510 RepID=A0A699I8U4_TANCI|nr:hypothetical protein [Tanacetum cinerariifolium]
MSLTFADTYNMVAHLNKFDASEGFNQIIDFLNGSYIKHALTINPHIYVSYIKQFWNTVIVKQSNNVTRLQALVDKKKAVITEATIKDAPRLDDAEGVNCLPNEDIFAKLAHMSYKKPSTNLTFYKAFFSSQWKFLIYTILQSLSTKRTSWNEFSSAMASAVICLSTGVETPLFEGMLVVGEIEEQGDAEEQVQDDVDDAATQGADTAVEGDVVHKTSIPSPTPPNLPPQQSQDLPSTSQETLDACAALARRVEHLEYDKVAQALEITKLKRRVKKLERGNKAKVLKLRRLKKVGTSQRTKSSDDTDMEDASNHGRMIDELDTDEVRVAAASTRRRKGVVIRDLEEESTAIIPADTKSKDKGKGIMVEEPKPLKKKQQVKMDEEYARKLREELNKDIDWNAAIDHVKQKDKEDPYVQRYQLEEEENRAIQSINETLAQKAAKRRKLNDEVEDLKQHLEIMPDEDDDVYTESTPLVRKVSVVDYEIIYFNNKPHYKIIRANGTHQLYVSFITLLKNFDIEDLESLWSLVKERFSTSKPNNFSDDYLLTTHGAMFERPDGQAQVQKNQRTVHGQARAKSWKLLESCGVHIITFTTTQLILLVERRYPLSRFTLDQLLNVVRLRVEERSEMSLELLRFIRQQHQEGQLE